MTSHRIRSLLLISLTIALSGLPNPSRAGETPSKSVRSLRNHFINSEQSTNWAGYGLAGNPLGFDAVTATWLVPSVPGTSSDTSSATWTGIGGGCVDPPTCAIVDETLIQAGTEQDNSSGVPTYSAWWEALPAPSMPLTGGVLSTQNYDVLPGDSITVTISSTGAVVWTSEIQNVRGGATHWTFSQTVPYTAAGLTAEWIEESPLVVRSSGAGQQSLSDFDRVLFTGLTANGAAPELTPDDKIILTDGSGNVLAQPSAPEGSGNEFAVCYGSGLCQYRRRLSMRGRREVHRRF
jgi:hypothetical protein